MDTLMPRCVQCSCYSQTNITNFIAPFRGFPVFKAQETPISSCWKDQATQITFRYWTEIIFWADHQFFRTFCYLQVGTNTEVAKTY